jgi:hypothetical protein
MGCRATDRAAPGLGNPVLWRALGSPRMQPGSNGPDCRGRAWQRKGGRRLLRRCPLWSAATTAAQQWAVHTDAGASGAECPASPPTRKMVRTSSRIGRDPRRRVAGIPCPAGRAARRNPAIPVQKQPDIRRAGLAQQVGEQPLPVDQPGLWIMRGADILSLVAPALNPGYPPAPPAQACLLPLVRPAAALQEGRLALEGPSLTTDRSLDVCKTLIRFHSSSRWA